jgi:hypothetical protein
VKRPGETQPSLRVVAERPGETPLSASLRVVVKRPGETPLSLRFVVDRPGETPPSVRVVVERPGETPLSLRVVVDRPGETPPSLRVVVERPGETPPSLRPAKPQAHVTSLQLFGNVANINSLFVPHRAPTKLSECSGIDMIRLRKTMSQLRKVKHTDYHSAMSEMLEHRVIPHLPSNVSFIWCCLGEG